ncbi:hypothetical protein CKO12_03065 [Chromatium okenii]|uniref:hypothetical protein n=1 Tax=Chromatium okenii TaxID=61644 RepID=UPI001908E6D5|nr:hypothetical protein [Chromatium okenii]MBK1640874.1 hypothetical protein [Chromatium okenii]
MSETCHNTLEVDGDSDKVSQFFAFTNALADIGRCFRDLEDNSNGDAECDWPCDSQGPWIDSFSTEGDSILWESRNYPSLWTVYELSKQFPNLRFILEFESIALGTSGKVKMRDGAILKQRSVNTNLNALEYLLEYHGAEIMRLELGEGTRFGCGDVDVMCTEAEETETEIIRKFDLEFQCDESPEIVIRISKEDGKTFDDILNDIEDEGWDICDATVEYSDDEGNENIEDNGCHGEMRIHVDDMDEGDDDEDEDDDD